MATPTPSRTDGGDPTPSAPWTRIIALDALGFAAFVLYATVAAPAGPIRTYTTGELAVAAVAAVATLAPLLAGLYLLVDHLRSREVEHPGQS